ncbi:MAG TPA: Ldh family oxidoreductase, partial [Humibacillus sp.]|nr:Ldh family oxidoreductase [Humibacillus sp.]
LIVIDVAAMSSTTEFASRMEQLVDATTSGELASWADEILVPGELEDRGRAANERDGIHLAATTWASLVALADETGTPLPHADATHPPDQTQEVHP